MHFYLSHDSPYEVVGFTVDREYIKENTFLGLPVVAFQEVELIFPPSEYKMLVPLSFRNMNRLRAEKYLQTKAKGYKFINYISSRACTWPDLVIGENCIVYENSVIMPFAKIGHNVVISTGSMIGDYCLVKDHSFLASHSVLLGNATVEESCVLGANSTVREGVRIARECLIGAGVTITRDTEERGVYINRPPELYPKPSNEVGAILAWPLR